MNIKNNSVPWVSNPLVDPNIVNTLIITLNRALGLGKNVPPTDYVLGVWDYVYNRQETHTYGAFGSDSPNYVQPFWKIRNINNLLFDSYYIFQNEDFEHNPSKKIVPRNVANGFFSLNEKKICVVDFSQDEDIHKMIALLYVTFFAAKTTLSKIDYKYVVETHIAEKTVKFKSAYQKNIVLQNIFKFFLEQVE